MSGTNEPYRHEEYNELIKKFADIEQRLARLESSLNHLHEAIERAASKDSFNALESKVADTVGKGEFAYVKYIAYAFTLAVMTGVLGIFFKLITTRMG